MNTVARAVHNIAKSNNTVPRTINVVHPRPISWKRLIVWIKDALVAAGKAEPAIVTWDVWLAKLESCSEDTDVLVRRLAIPNSNFIHPVLTSARSQDVTILSNLQ
jgi:hypothetical protein